MARGVQALIAGVDASLTGRDLEDAKPEAMDEFMMGRYRGAAEHTESASRSEKNRAGAVTITLVKSYFRVQQPNQNFPPAA